jgi:pimeloyl-ACP methyl ester carboxylesterase
MGILWLLIRRIKVLGLAALSAAAMLLAGWVVLARTFGSMPPTRPAAGDRFVVADGAHIRYRVLGTGDPTLVFLHGFGGRIESWGSLLERVNCGRRIAVDLPGFGASSRPDRPYTLERQARTVVGVLDAMGIARAVLVGFSMGGGVAAVVAARDPGRVATLVLLAPAGLPGSLFRPGLRGWLARPGVANRAAWWLARLAPFGWLFPDQLTRQGLSVAASYDSAYADLLGGITAPTIILWAQADPRERYAYAEEYLHRIQGAQLVTEPVSAVHGYDATEEPWVAREICDFVGLRGQ